MYEAQTRTRILIASASVSVSAEVLRFLRARGLARPRVADQAAARQLRAEHC
jgi:post-segregation antitoxin (ccd killing protein)